MIKAIIFDCFGVLVGRGFEETYRIAGGDPVKDRRFIEDILGQANLGLISSDAFHEAMTRQLGITPSEWEQAVITAERPNETLLAYIKNLRHKYKTAILSNANKGVVEHRVGRRWIEEAFDAVVVSADVGMVKPDPRIYTHVVDKLGMLPEECVLIDDRQAFLDGAAVLGIKTVLYDDFEQARAEIESILADPKN